ncbi:hypothetical protein A6A29_34005 [Streptomyces sp. TSRI0281]|nr:hypothetical protein [Streptomyces sp. TSRI0281]OKI44758.1 hypothetical protein A6A29_34005 [Streptomyces sp. TSRI0281]
MDRAEEIDLGVHRTVAAVVEAPPGPLEELGEPRLDQGASLSVLSPTCWGGEAIRHVLLAGRAG